MADLIIGTAGHVDHGKTALVQQLTGHDTDRLPEEQQRGISIDLGFASFQLPDGRTVGIVDVPGHQRFIKNMVAGASGIDLVLLVVAADEGVMPQTREHLDILTLLGVELGLVVVTKVDLVEQDWLELVAADLDDALVDTFLARAPRCWVSSRTGQGFDQLKAQISALLPRARKRSAAGYARLPIDRVFTVKGFGTVVTGTVVSGRIRVEDQLQLLPADKTVRVRQIQIHGREADGVQAGQRAALNLAGIDHGAIKRGDVLAAPAALAPTDIFAGQLHLLPTADKPLPNQARIHLHTGTTTTVGRIILLDHRQLEPGETAFVRFRGETPLVATYGDRFIVRSYSPVTTIGGGLVLDALGHYRRHRQEDLEHLAVLARGDLAAAALAQLQRAGGIAEAARLAYSLTVPPQELAAALAELLKQGRLHCLAGDQLYVTNQAWQTVKSLLEERLADFHRRYPLRPGMPREQLLEPVVRACPPAAPLAWHGGLQAKSFTELLEAFARQGTVVLLDEGVALPDFTPAPRGETAQQVAALLAAFQADGAAPPPPEEVFAPLQLPPEKGREFIAYLTATGQLIKVADQFYLPADVYRQQLAAVVEAAGDQGATAGQLRDALNTSRKYAIPFLEHLDEQGYTRRQGELRVVTGRGRRAARLKDLQDDAP